MSKEDNFLKELIKESGNEYASIVDDGITAGDVSGFISTGSYALNALLSGSVYGGLPANKVTALAGETAVGKSFYAINIVRQFLYDNPEGHVVYFESESAISKEMMESRNVDVKRVALFPVSTVQEFRTMAVKFLDKYIEKKDKKPLMFVLDSLGNLSTDKEMSDISEGKDTRDMTRAQLIRGAFRVLTLKLGKANVPLIVTNHTYAVIGQYVPIQKQSGGSGLDYAASTIIFLSKKKNKDADKTVTGVIITANAQKSRLTIENRKVETLLNYNTGLDPYYGLLDIAEQTGIFKKVSTRYELPDGQKVFETEINRNPEKYFTKKILDNIDEKCADIFLYGTEIKENVGEQENGNK